jgi:competence protein ComEC
MKLPAVIVVAAFAAGIALLGALPVGPGVWIALVVVTLLVGFGFLLRRLLVLALILGAAAWCFLGALAARLEQIAVPQNHVAALVADSRLDTSDPLRWRGLLRNDPLRFPWGWRYEIDLEEVEVAGKPRPVEGGLRVSLFRNEQRCETPPDVRAGDRVEALVRARPPRNFLNPGAFDARAHLARQGIHLTGSLRSAELLRRVDNPRPGLGHRLARQRGQLLERIDAMFSRAPERGAIAKAMLLGDRSFVDHEVADVFQKTAAYHVLVISGLHVAALAGFVYFLGRALRLSQLTTTLITLAVLAGYVALVEDRPPIERAALMATVFLVSRLAFRRVELLNTIAVAALIVLTIRPSSLADPSFQLSFLAVTMIGALALPWAERTSVPYRRALEHVDDVTRDAAHPPRAAQFRLDVRAVGAWLANRLPQRLSHSATLAVTLPLRATLRIWEIVLVFATIQFGMLPLMAYYFQRVALTGPLANIPAPILTGMIVPVGFVSLGVSLVWEWLGGLISKLLDILVGALLASVNWFSGWRWASYRIPGPPFWLMLAFFLLIVLLAIAARAQRARWQAVVAVPTVVCAICLAWYPFAPDLRKGELEITVLDVGQGDSILVAFPGGRILLEDGGGTFAPARVGGIRTGFDVGEQVVSTYLWSRGIRRLDVVALTHAHQDHIGGLYFILDNFRVGELWIGRDVDAPDFRALAEHARARGVPVVHKRRGETFEWTGVTGLVLWPEDTTEASQASNNDSLVLRLEHGSNTVLLTGDIERKIELDLVERGDPLDADFLKVPHHGSRTSASADFLDGVTPRVAVLSLGENNPFGYPHREVLERLMRSGACLLRTDRDGAVTARSNGRTWRVASYTAPQEKPLSDCK